MIQKKLDVKMVSSDPPAAVNLCESVKEVQEMVINYTYKDLGRQMMILDLGAPVSIAGTSWMRQYLAEFDLEIEDMKSVSCNQPFVFGPSKRYMSKSLVELPILLTRMDEKRGCASWWKLKFLSCVVSKLLKHGTLRLMGKRKS